MAKTPETRVLWGFKAVFDSPEGAPGGRKKKHRRI